jgi:hypothetical protein
MAKIETLGEWRREALGLMDRAEGEIRKNSRLSGYGGDDFGFTGHRIRSFASEMEALVELLPACQIKDRAKIGVDVLHQLCQFEPGDELSATALLGTARNTLNGLGKPGR